MADAMLDDLRKKSDAAWANLTRQLQGMEPHLERADAPGQWTVREVLAHLLDGSGTDPVAAMKRFSAGALPTVELGAAQPDRLRARPPGGDGARRGAPDRAAPPGAPPRGPLTWCTIPGMAILKVARLGHPVLRKVAAPVPPEAISSPETQRLIDDMIETMREYNGAGLAATQVHTLLQVAVIEVQANPRYPDAPPIPLTVLINPVVSPLTEETELGWEGCLSVPDLRGMVPRFTSVRLEARDRAGHRIDLVAKDFFARVIQHESDHLNGVVYLDRMKDLSTLTHLAEWGKYWLGAREQDD
jgi:peptide deformylase